MDEFERAGLDEETCEKLRRIAKETGIDPCILNSAARTYMTEEYPLNEYEKLEIAWDAFLQDMWDELQKSKIGQFIIQLAEKLRDALEG